MSDIREPRDSELKDCAELIHISGEELMDYIFASMQKEIMQMFFKKEGTLFSSKNILVNSEEGSVRGMILAYPVCEERAMSRKMLGLLGKMLRITKLKGIAKIIGRMDLNRYFPEKYEDEYFISYLAVFSEYRGKGVGVSLLKAAEEAALEKGLKKLSLYVETDNEHAKRIYEKFGFAETASVSLPEKFRIHGIHGFYKMVKDIEKGASS